MKSCLFIVLFILISGQLVAQDSEVSYTDTEKVYVAPVIYYDDSLVPSVITNEIMRHIVSKSNVRSVYPQIGPLQQYFRKSWEINSICYDTQIIVPDFACQFTAFYWDNRMKCFKAMNAVVKKQ